MSHNATSVADSVLIGSSHKTIPWLNMSSFLYGTKEQRIRAAKIFGESLQNIGFVAATNIGINSATIDRAYAITEQFFALPEQEKMRYYAKDGYQGFSPFGSEHAKYTSILDLKEFYQTTGPSQPKSLWPDLPKFKEEMSQLYSELENCMRYCLQATAIYLGYPLEQQSILADLLGSGNGVMRILHYPPVDPASVPPGAIRAAPHEDLCIMTIIPRATQSGLQVQTREGEWLDVIIPEGAAIINAGDTLNYLTNGIIPSTTHRVINPPYNDGSHRYSIPFFGNLAADTIIKVLDKCRNVNSSTPLLPEIKFRDFMAKRYQEIGFKGWEKS